MNSYEYIETANLTSENIAFNKRIHRGANPTGAILKVQEGTATFNYVVFERDGRKKSTAVRAIDLDDDSVLLYTCTGMLRIEKATGQILDSL